MPNPILSRILGQRSSIATPPFLPPNFDLGEQEELGSLDPSYSPPTSAERTPVEMAAEQVQTASIRPPSSLRRRILGGLMQAGSVMAGGFGVPPQLVQRWGQDVAYPGMAERQAHAAQNLGLAQTLEESEMARRKMAATERENEEMARSREEQRRATEAYRERMDFDRDVGLYQQGMDKIRGDYGEPIEPGLPPAPGTMRSQVYNPFSRQLEAYSLPPRAQAESRRAREQAALKTEGEMQATPKFLSDYFSKKGESLPARLPRSSIDDYLRAYTAEMGAETARRGQSIRLEQGDRSGDRSRERAMRTNLQQLSREFLPVYDNYKIIKSVDPKNAQSQIAGLYAMIKLLDPNSVVRESEVHLTREASPLLANIVNSFKKVVTGTPLPPQVMESYIREAENLYKSHATTYFPRVKSIQQFAQDTGLDTEYITSGAIMDDLSETGGGKITVHKLRPDGTAEVRRGVPSSSLPAFEAQGWKRGEPPASAPKPSPTKKKGGR